MASEVTPEHPGYSDVQVLDGDCAYAKQVAHSWVNAWQDSCLEGCTRLVEDIPCTYDAVNVSDEVICSAARTEVRFKPFFFDV